MSRVKRRPLSMMDVMLYNLAYAAYAVGLIWIALAGSWTS